MEKFEYSTEREIFYNYCLWNYEPLAPVCGKLRASNLLFRSFELEDAGDRAHLLVQKLREAVGDSRTVWGVKRWEDRTTWEFYFYDYARRNRRNSMSVVIEAMKPIAACGIKPNESLHYFMFSIDIDKELVSGNTAIDEIHMYLGNPGSTVSAGINYSLTARATRLENFYFFFDPRRHLEDISAKIACSAFIDTTRLSLKKILWPELLDCSTICVANKQQNDCVYFSGINVQQFLWFLRRMDYPAETVSFVIKHMSSLDHLKYDVGIDYRMEGDELVVLKSAYYGNF